MARDVPTNEWVELVSAVEEGWYSLQIEGDDVDLAFDEKPNQPEAGVRGREGDFLPIEVTDLDGVYAKAKEVGATVRAATGRVERQARRDQRVSGQDPTGDYSPVSVTTGGTVQTNNYSAAGGFDYDGSAYPYTVNPSETIQFLHITQAGDIVAHVTTVSGDTADIPLAGGSGVIDWLEIDSVEFRDPNGTTARIAGSWGGE